jgi:NitT/TauT family transport system substrate-binding protein
LLKGAKWVHLNPVAAAKLAVEKKYVAATAEINAQAIRALKYEPGIAKCKQNIHEICLEMKKTGFLKSRTDPEELAKNAWLELDGVSDKWIKSLKVKQIAGGGPVPILTGKAFAAIFDRGPLCDDSGGMGCCDPSGSALLPMTGEWALVRPTRLDRKLNPEGGNDFGQSIR